MVETSQRLSKRGIAVVVTAESVAGFAGLLADRSRAAMCLALLDGRAWTAGELASEAGIGRPTATEHLNALVQAGLLAEVRQGRHRYVRIATPEFAQLIEELAAFAGEPERPRSLLSVQAGNHLAAARTCYDHLAGTLGVTMYDALVAGGLLAVRDGTVLTPAGREWVVALAGEPALHPRGRRPLLRTCLDWTERRTHLGGALGAVLCQQFIDRDWITRTRDYRAIAVTDVGAEALTDLLGVTIAATAARRRTDVRRAG
jgi:DNA-binding transcriptional ArsR family regulator